MVLGAIRNGKRSFDKIRKTTNLDPEEMNRILEQLERLKMIRVEEKKGWLGRKVEIVTTEKGEQELDEQIHEMQKKWGQMVTLYNAGDKSKLNDMMGGYRSFIPMMIFFGVIDMMMFSMMFSMMGASMADYVPADQMPADMDSGHDAGSDSGGMDDGGFDIDIGF